MILCLYEIYLFQMTNFYLFLSLFKLKFYENFNWWKQKDSIKKN